MPMGQLEYSANFIFDGSSVWSGSGTMVFPSTTGYNGFSSGAGASNGVNITNTSTTGYIQLLLAQTTSNYGGFFKWNSAYVGNYTGTSVAFASTFQVQAGNANQQDLVLSSGRLLWNGGQASGNTAVNISNSGIKIGTNADLHTDGTMRLQINSGRFGQSQGADVASAAGAIALGADGNTFEITGTSSITLISNVNWQNGSVIHLIFTSTATLTDGTANSGTDIGMELAGGANFTGSADDVVTLILSEMGGTQRWREVSRSVN